MGLGLGFSMRTKKAKIFLQVIAWLALPFLMSCFSAEPEERPFGDEVSAQSVADALNKPFDTLDPLSIKVGEFVHIETNQAISGGAKFVTQDTGLTVIDRQETSDSVRLTLAVQEVVYSSDGTSSSTTFEENIDLPKTSTSALSVNNVITGKSLAELSGSQLQTLNTIAVCEPTRNSAVTFHNLKVASSQQAVPSQVLNSAFCTGESNCDINVMSIRFDQVVKNGESSEKISCEYIYSTEVPFLSGQMKKCVTMAVPIDGRSLIVTECAEILNFVFGNS